MCNQLLVFINMVMYMPHYKVDTCRVWVGGQLLMSIKIKMVSYIMNGMKGIVNRLQNTYLSPG